MKLEKGSFLALSGLETPSLNDPTLVVDDVLLWVDGTNSSHGYDDGTTQVCGIGSSADTDTGNSVHVKSGGTTVLKGKVTRKDVGEFDVTFANYNGALVNFLAIER